MNLALWIIAGLLAALMLNAATKLFVPREKLATKYGREWMADNSDSFVKSIGALELLAAVGLILPAALDIAPILVPLAAVGVALMMVGGDPRAPTPSRGRASRAERDLPRHGRLPSMGPLRPRVLHLTGCSV